MTDILETIQHNVYLSIVAGKWHIFSGIIRDKTNDEKLIYILNDDKQDYFFL